MENTAINPRTNKPYVMVQAADAKTGMQSCTCAWCGKPFKARAADIKRGWGKFCSKSCKASKQEKSTGQYRAHITRARTRAAVVDDSMDYRPEGWDEDGWRSDDSGCGLF